MIDMRMIRPVMPPPRPLMIYDLRAKRWRDASRALEQGRRVGLLDVDILTQVAAEYELSGRLGEAAEVLKWAISSPPVSFEVRYSTRLVDLMLDAWINL